MASQWMGNYFPAQPPSPEGPRNDGALKAALILAGAIVFAAVAAVVVAIAVRQPRPSDGHQASATETLSTAPSLNPHTATSLTDWSQFGGIDAHPGQQADSIVLDTHNTTDTWTTKWSGLTDPVGSACTLHFSARVRDISHTLGVPGGYGIGLATTQNDPSGQVTLNGTAIQYDFGQQGYRTATYPDDGAFGIVPASLDHDWHNIEVSFDSEGIVSETADGVVVVHQSVSKLCGQPVIRVWAGAVEFADVTFSS